jgi:hypothetical protein
MRDRLALIAVVAAALAIPLGCSVSAEHSEEGDAGGHMISLSDLPAPARSAIEGVTAGGKIEKIGREIEGGVIVYDVEAQVGGKHVEYDIDANGNILTSEEEVPYESLPASVRAAVEDYFGSSEGVMASREIEKGETFYEVAGTEGTERAEIKLTGSGRIVEED